MLAFVGQEWRCCLLPAWRAAFTRSVRCARKSDPWTQATLNKGLRHPCLEHLAAAAAAARWAVALTFGRQGGYGKMIPLEHAAVQLVDVGKALSHQEPSAFRPQPFRP
eukprot:s765_g16.t1